MPMPMPARRTTRRHALAAAAAVLVFSGLPGCAGEAVAMPSPVSLSVVDRETGQELPLHHHRGRDWVAGRPGARYALRLRNAGGTRVLAVLSVDGVNVVTGETAAWDQAGYVLEPGSSGDISGWRKSDSEVAAFVFAAAPASYAARTGRPGHVGVLGMAVFAERARPEAESPPVARAAPGAAAPLADAARDRSADESRQARRLGTAHGPREWSVVEQVGFERAGPTPQVVVRIGYDSLENLRAAGILPPPRRPAWPEPFPGSGPAVGYVPDPPR